MGASPAMPKAPSLPRDPGMRCPHCGVLAVARSSTFISNTCKEILFQCRNPLCSFSWIAGMQAIRQVSPSGTPRPGVQIPATAIPFLTRRY